MRYMQIISISTDKHSFDSIQYRPSIEFMRAYVAYMYM